jgi:hypothetical protein
MKFKLFLFAASLLGLIACGSNPVVVMPDPQPDPPSATSEVSGQVVEWQQKGRPGISRAVISAPDASAASGFAHAVVAQGSIDAQGRLALKLINAPAASFLKPFEVCGIKTEARAIEANIDVAQVGLETDASTFFAFLGQEDDSAQVIRVYSDRNLEIDAPCTDGGISAKLSLKKGWNLMLKSFTQPGKVGAVYSTASAVAGVPFMIKLLR